MRILKNVYFMTSKLLHDLPLYFITYLPNHNIQLIGIQRKTLKNQKSTSGLHDAPIECTQPKIIKTFILTISVGGSD